LLVPVIVIFIFEPLFVVLVAGDFLLGMYGEGFDA